MRCSNSGGKRRKPVRTDFAFEEKALDSISRLVGYVIRAMLIIALFLGSCLLCTSPAMETETVTAITFRSVGTIGYIVSIFFAYRLYRNMKKHK